jgi:putative membrane protein insertion efficiency factor
VNPSARVIVASIRFYQRSVSPAFAPKCRYTPTCSAYAADAISIYGLGKGLWMALRRLLRCHPYHRGGFDPVPPRAQISSVIETSGVTAGLRSTTC